MDRLRAETGADPMPDPLASLPGDEQDGAVSDTDDVPPGSDAAHGRAVPSDPEDELVDGSHRSPG